MRQAESGYSLFELCVLGAAIAAVGACAIPGTQAARVATNAVADRAQLRTHYTWLQLYKAKHKRALPSEGGYKFVLSTWTSKVFDHTAENLDRYFSPGARDSDPDYRTVREFLVKGEDPWPDLASVTSVDTHYVGRSRRHLRTAGMPGEALMATDNEGHSVFADGTVNVLRSDGVVRGYAYSELRELYDVPEFVPNKPVLTWGMDSPIPECRKLDQ